jgi:ribosomal protein S18 acetylase RimI-like enzyme
MQWHMEPIGAAHSVAVRKEALMLVLRQIPQAAAENLATVAAAGLDTPDAPAGLLWRAVGDQDRLLGAVWAQPQAGGVVAIWPPQWNNVRAPKPDPLLTALLTSLVRAGFRVAQSLLPDATVPEATSLLGCGFQIAAELHYLSAAARSDLPRRFKTLHFTPYAPERRDDLAAVIGRTYEGSLDCPILEGMRPVTDVLDEYEAVGAHRPELWLFAEADEGAVGCLLLADHAEQDQLELLYMGLVPEVRGRGWGEELAREALRQAARQRRSRVVAAVDGKNVPAVELYRRNGYETWDKRTALVKKLGD